MKKLVLLAIAILSVGSLTASAAGVTVTVGGPSAVDIPIPADLTYAISGPVTWGNYTWSSTNEFNNGGSVFGYTGSVGFEDNGYWDSSVGPVIALNDANGGVNGWGVTDTMTISFKNPVTSFGDLFNYDPDGTTPTTINVYDVNGNLLDSYDLNFSTNGANNSGEWLTFSSTTPIGSFTMSDNYIAMATSPEPSTVSFFLVAVLCGGALFLARRKASAN